MKCQLVRATIEAIEAIWDEAPRARICQCEPAIHIAADPLKPDGHEAAEAYRIFQFQSLDMLCGRDCPELGGHPRYLDIVGLNYYWNNQWIDHGRILLRDDPLYRPFQYLIAEYHRRYRRPLFISETGIEGEHRPNWLRYITSQAAAALEAGVPVMGICLYPILNHPGWDDDRHCYCGVFDYADENGLREACEPLAGELRTCQEMIQSVAELELV
ncbi:MAG: hypothetical protein JO022_17670 [Acidobacteriaceae bacterium]|nr:hypothetical protein [Acidobacteriaceae bacterium]